MKKVFLVSNLLIYFNCFLTVSAKSFSECAKENIVNEKGYYSHIERKGHIRNQRSAKLKDLKKGDLVVFHLSHQLPAPPVNGNFLGLEVKAEIVNINIPESIHEEGSIDLKRNLVAKANQYSKPENRDLSYLAEIKGVGNLSIKHANGDDITYQKFFNTYSFDYYNLPYTIGAIAALPFTMYFLGSEGEQGQSVFKNISAVSLATAASLITIPLSPFLGSYLYFKGPNTTIFENTGYNWTWFNLCVE